MLEKIMTREVISPILIVFCAIVLNLIIRNIVKKTFGLKIKGKKINNKKSKTIIGLINNIIKYFIIIVAILMILDVYGIDTKTLVASLGVVGLAIGLALQDILKDFLAGLTIIFDNQYAVGDVVLIGDFKGEVISLGIKTTKLKAFTGEIKIISNRNISEVTNYSLTNSLALVDISVSYESDLEKVEKVLAEMCKKLNNLDGLKGELQLLGLNKLGDSSIEYRIIAETESLKNYEIERIIKREAKSILDKNHIQIPYPQLVIHNE